MVGDCETEQRCTLTPVTCQIGCEPSHMQQGGGVACGRRAELLSRWGLLSGGANSSHLRFVFRQALCQRTHTSACLHMRSLSFAALEKAEGLSSSAASALIRGARCQRSKVSSYLTQTWCLTSERPCEGSARLRVRLSVVWKLPLAWALRMNTCADRRRSVPPHAWKVTKGATHLKHPSRIRHLPALFLPRNKGFPGQIVPQR